MILTDLPHGVDALAFALRFDCPRPECLRELVDSEWQNLFRRWDIQRLMIPLRSLHGEYIPDWVKERIDCGIADNSERFERIKTAYLRFSDALRPIGAEHLVIKGFAQWPHFVDDPRLRLQSDIDVYCPPDSILRARDALIELGYEAVHGLNFDVADHLPTMASKTPWVWRDNYYDPDIPASFELHFRFWNRELTKLELNGIDQFWSRRISRQLENIQFHSLNEIDNLGYTALNLTRNLLWDGSSAYQVYELAGFLQKTSNREQFWQEWNSSHNDSLRALEVVAFVMAYHCFGCRIPEVAESTIQRLPPLARVWLKKCCALPFTQQSRPNKNGTWLHVSLLQPGCNKTAMLSRHLIPRIPQIERIDLLGIVKNTRSTSSFDRFAKYIRWAVSRSFHHSRLLRNTLVDGFELWWGESELGRSFFIFLTVSFLFTLGMYIFFFLYNPYLLDRGFAESFIGMNTSALTLGGVAGTLPAGLLAERVGLRNALLVCIALVSILSLMRSLAVSQPALLLISFLAGAASAIWAVTLPPAVAQFTNEGNRPLGFSLVFFLGIGVGLLGSGIGGFLPHWVMKLASNLANVRAERFALVIACAIVGLSIFPALHLRFPGEHKSSARIYHFNPFLRRFLGAIGIWGLAVGMFAPFFSMYFYKYLRMPLKQVGLIDSAAHVPQLLGLLAAPFIFKKIGLVRTIVFTQIATAIALGCLASVSGPTAAMAIYLAYVTFQWMNEPGLYSLLMDRVPQAERNGASALNFFVLNAAQAVSAVIAGSGFVKFGYPAVLTAASILALLAALLFGLLLGKPHDSASESSTIASYGH